MSEMHLHHTDRPHSRIDHIEKKQWMCLGQSGRNVHRSPTSLKFYGYGVNMGEGIEVMVDEMR